MGSGLLRHAEINTAYRRHALACHPDKIPLSDSDEVRSAKIKHFRALGDAKSVLLNPERRAAYDQHRNQAPKDSPDEPSMSLAEAYRVWVAAVLGAFKRSNTNTNAATCLKLVDPGIDDCHGRGRRRRPPLHDPGALAGRRFAG